MILKRIAAVAAALLLVSTPVALNCTVDTAPTVSITAYADYEEPSGEVMLLSTKTDDEDEDTSVTKSRSESSDFNPVMSFIISLIIGLIAALIVVGSMKSKLKTVRSKTGASDYKIKDSFKLSERSDNFLYKKVEKTARAQTNNR